MEIQKHRDNINRENGCHLSAIWKPLLQVPPPPLNQLFRRNALVLYKPGIQRYTSNFLEKRTLKKKAQQPSRTHFPRRHHPQTTSDQIPGVGWGSYWIPE
ncbi:hypothetical protein Trydic_g20756 [Trypoxylus dichotomus]